MSKIGGQNEVAAMSVGLTVDTAGLDASLAEARKKLDDFKQESERVPIKPTTPANLPVDKTTTPGKLPFDPRDTPIFPGAGKGPGYDIAPEIEKTDQAVKKTSFSWKELAQEVSAASTAVFGFIGVSGAVVAGLTTIGRAGEYVGNQLANTASKLQELHNAAIDFNRVFDLQAKTQMERQDRRLAASGILPLQRERLLNTEQGALQKQRAAEVELANQEARGYEWSDAFHDLAFGPFSWFGTIESDRRKKTRLAREQLATANSEQKAASDQIRGLTSDVPVSGFINTDAGLGSSVRTMSISNVRMDQRDEQARKAEYSQRQVEANRRRSP